MGYYTANDIKSMTDEEVNELSKKLAGEVLKRYLLLMTIKWALIIGTTRALRKYIESRSHD